jgi:hypothetical protein
MAIDRSAGTEIIRTASFEALTGATTHQLIFGVQHHIYTVLSVVVSCLGLSATTHYAQLWIKGYDSFEGTTAQEHQIFKAYIPETETFVWNDKFSFNGHEPTDFTGPMDSIVKQDAIADQASSVAQKLEFHTGYTGTVFDVSVTYIDQNNS